MSPPIMPQLYGILCLVSCLVSVIERHNFNGDTTIDHHEMNYSSRLRRTLVKKLVNVIGKFSFEADNDMWTMEYIHLMIFWCCNSVDNC